MHTVEHANRKVQGPAIGKRGSGSETVENFIH
jgi:hypothetical protein